MNKFFIILKSIITHKKIILITIGALVFILITVKTFRSNHTNKLVDQSNAVTSQKMNVTKNINEKPRRLPRNNTTIALVQNEFVELSWEHIPNNSYYVIIKDSKGRQKTYFSNSNKFKLHAPTGSYIEWKIQPSLSQNDSHLNQFYKISLKHNGEIKFISKKDEFNISKNTPEFSWSSSIDDTFEVTLLNSDDKKVIKKINTDSNFIKLKDLSVGSYIIKIKPLDHPGIKDISHNFKVISPILSWDKKSITKLNSSEVNNQLKLRFKSHHESTSNVKVFFKNRSPAEAQEINLDKVNMINLDGYGKHCFHASLQEDNPYYVNSDEFCVEVVETSAITIKEKINDTILSYAASDKLDTYLIKVPKIKLARKYIYHIYEDQEGKNLVYTLESLRPQVEWNTNRTGIYYMRYKAIDKKNLESELSPASKIIFPISPLVDFE